MDKKQKEFWKQFCQSKNTDEETLKKLLFSGDLTNEEFECIISCITGPLFAPSLFYPALFKKCPQLMDRCNWTMLNHVEWRNLLMEYPQFADKCDKWDEFDSTDWVNLLRGQPKFADKCDKWNKFNAEAWCFLLIEQPQFADKCNKWSCLDFDSLKFLLLRHPQFFDKYPSRIWQHFSAVDYKRLLVKNNKIAEKLGGKNWSQLLCKYPQFGEICDWDKLDTSNWAFLLRRCPDFAEKCDKYDDFSATDWKNLLSEQPQFADKCAWHKINRNTILVDLLMKQPQLITRCNISIITEKGKAKLLAKHLNLAKYFPEAEKKDALNQPELF